MCHPDQTSSLGIFPRPLICHSGLEVEVKKRASFKAESVSFVLCTIWSDCFTVSWRSADTVFGGRINRARLLHSESGMKDKALKIGFSVGPLNLDFISIKRAAGKCAFRLRSGAEMCLWNGTKCWGKMPSGCSLIQCSSLEWRQGEWGCVWLLLAATWMQKWNNGCEVKQLSRSLRSCDDGASYRPFSAKSCKLDAFATVSESSYAGVSFNDRLSATTPASLPRWRSTSLLHFLLVWTRH